MMATNLGPTFARCMVGLLLCACGGSANDGALPMGATANASGHGGASPSMLAPIRSTAAANAGASGQVVAGSAGRTTAAPASVGSGGVPMLQPNMQSIAGMGGVLGRAAGTAGSSIVAGASGTNSAGAGGAGASGQRAARYDGDWSGMTSQGKPLSFSIASDTLTNLQWTVKVMGDVCDVSDATSTTTTKTPLLNDGFMFSSKAGEWSRLINARFRSESTVDGDFSADFKASDSGKSKHFPRYA
jgi:hypothetical protein